MIDFARTKRLARQIVEALLLALLIYGLFLACLLGGRPVMCGIISYVVVMGLCVWAGLRLNKTSKSGC